MVFAKICYWIRGRVGSVVEWLKRRAHDQHGLGSKSTRAILLYPWERHLTAHSPAWRSWQTVLNYSHIFIKLQADSNILVSPEAGWGNCLPYVLGLRRFPASREDKYRDKIKNNKKDMDESWKHDYHITWCLLQKGALVQRKRSSF